MEGGGSKSAPASRGCPRLGSNDHGGWQPRLFGLKIISAIVSEICENVRQGEQVVAGGGWRQARSEVTGRAGDSTGAAERVGVVQPKNYQRHDYQKMRRGEQFGGGWRVASGEWRVAGGG